MNILIIWEIAAACANIRCGMWKGEVCSSHVLCVLFCPYDLRSEGGKKIQVTFAAQKLNVTSLFYIMRTILG